MALFYRKLVRYVLIVLPVAAIAAVLLIVNPLNYPPDAQSAIAKSLEAAAGVQSYRMSFSGTQISDNGSSEILAELTFAVPDRTRLKLTVDGRTNEYISTGGEEFVNTGEGPVNSMVVFATGRFAALTESQPAEYLKSLEKIQILPEEEIDGVICLHYRGLCPDQGMEDMIAEMEKDLTEEQIQHLEKEFGVLSSTIEIELWIARDDYLLRQMTRNRTGGEKMHGIHSSTIRYYDFNRSVAIDPPLDSAGQLLPGWERE